MKKTCWAELHKASQSIINTDLTLKSSKLFLGKLDFQTGHPDEKPAKTHSQDAVCSHDTRVIL